MRFALLVVLSAAVLAQTQRIEFLTLNEDILQQRLRMAVPKNADRYQRLRALFEAAGCTGASYREQLVKGSKQPNLICDVDGTEPAERIVIGAHYDSIGGDGIIDNWSGAVMLPALAGFLRTRPPKHTFEFVAFAAEEDGLLGSRAYLKAIPKADRPQIHAMIGLDSLGLGPTECWPASSTKELMQAGWVLANALKLRFTGIEIPPGASTDSMTFKESKIPVLSLTSVTRETWDVVNGQRDVWKEVRWRDYYDSHKFVSALLVYLDQNLPQLLESKSGRRVDRGSAPGGDSAGAQQ